MTATPLYMNSFVVNHVGVSYCGDKRIDKRCNVITGHILRSEKQNAAVSVSDVQLMGFGNPRMKLSMAECANF